MSDDPDREAYDAGQRAWPDVALDRAQLAAFIARAAPGAARRFPTDLYLVAACLTGNPAALTAFDRELVAAGRGAICAIDASDAFVDEAFQRLRAVLLVGDRPRLADYAGRGPLRAWIGISAARTALMIRRADHRAREVLAESEDDWMAALATVSTQHPELELLKRQYADAFGGALRDAIQGLEPRLRAALRMSFVDSLSIDEIAAMYAVHRATAARWIQRACEAIASTTRALLAERLQLSEPELARMTALVQSQLDVSLSQLLPEAFAPPS